MALKWSYKVLYSTQLQKKNKSWSDGYLNYVVSLKKAVLLDESGRTLDVLQPVNAGDLQVGGELVMERHVVTVDEGPIDLPFQTTGKVIVTPYDGASEPECVNQTPAPSITTGAMFAILYSKDKSKKAKKWLDGYVVVGSDANILTIFYGEDGQNILKKALSNAADVYDGAIFETGSYLIEISNPISKPPVRFSGKAAETEDTLHLDVVYDCDVEEDEVIFEMVYTEDMVKKSKKWLDGFVVYHKENELCRFYDENWKEIFKRVVPWRKLDQQEELKSARFIFQIGNRSTARRVEYVPSAFEKAKKCKTEPLEISEEDKNLFMEFECRYTTDIMKRTKRWSDGLLWYTGGECKIFDEEEKLIFKKKMASKDIVDGIEFRHGNKLIVIGCQKHSYPINEPADANDSGDAHCSQQESNENNTQDNMTTKALSGKAQQSTKENNTQVNMKSNGRSVDELARFFKRQ